MHTCSVLRSIVEIESGRKAQRERWAMDCPSNKFQYAWKASDHHKIKSNIIDINDLESLSQPTMKSPGVSLCSYTSINQSPDLHKQ